MKNKELLPCPFCGGEASFRNINGLEYAEYVQCDCCSACTAVYVNKEVATKWWNTRTNKIPVGNGENYEVTHNG